MVEKLKSSEYESSRPKPCGRVFVAASSKPAVLSMRWAAGMSSVGKFVLDGRLTWLPGMQKLAPRGQGKVMRVGLKVAV